METLEVYFDYVVTHLICGIPEITLEGTVQDWQKVMEKTKQLGKYDLNWWTDELLPILHKIKATSNGMVDIDFWRNMFKVHTLEEYGAPKVIDGWIVKFFPYDRHGERRDLNQLKLSHIKWLPNEQVKVKFKYCVRNDENQLVAKYPMEFIGGFVGLQQDKVSLALRPEIGWLIGHQEKESQNFNPERTDNLIVHNITTFPIEILKQKDIRFLRLYFQNEVVIPKEIVEMNLSAIFINGKISKTEIQRLRKLLPNTYLEINGQNMNQKILY